MVLHGDGVSGAGGGAREGTKCWVVMMLYRRLALSGFRTFTPLPPLLLVVRVESVLLH